MKTVSPEDINKQRSYVYIFFARDALKILEENSFGRDLRLQCQHRR
jgi:hypothetical protein